MVSPLARVTGGQLFRSTCAACLADAGSGGSSRDSVVSGVADAACAWLEDIALEKPGTMAMTSVPSIANRLACIQWRRVQRPLKPRSEERRGGQEGFSTCRSRGAADP